MKTVEVRITDKQLAWLNANKGSKSIPSFLTEIAAGAIDGRIFMEEHESEIKNIAGEVK